ncbi:MAG: formyl transferase [Actinomycetota bacterium]|nr:formyl transferase [Actinomycetota bacterium]
MGAIVLLCSDNPASRIIFHALQDRFGQVSVIQEEPVPQTVLLRRRAARLGPVKVAGQVLFRAAVVPWLTLRGRDRVAEIKRQLQLDDRPMVEVEHVSSMNDTGARERLASIHPVITVVCGTRILSRETLAALNGPVVNFHAGITPLYRGVHGGYWALVDGHRDLVGSTIHRIDPGIDTGEVIAQATFDVTPADSFVTYPYLHVAAALGPLADVVRRALDGDDLVSQPHRSDLDSRLRTHPTLFEYLRSARRGVR